MLQALSALLPPADQYGPIGLPMPAYSVLAVEELQHSPVSTRLRSIRSGAAACDGGPSRGNRMNSQFQLEATAAAVAAMQAGPEAEYFQSERILHIGKTRFAFFRRYIDKQQLISRIPDLSGIVDAQGRELRYQTAEVDGALMLLFMPNGLACVAFHVSRQPMNQQSVDKALIYLPVPIIPPHLFWAEYRANSRRGHPRPARPAAS